MAAVDARRQQLGIVLPTEVIWIAADANRVQQMLLNLLGNAIKYTPTGGHISVSATIEAEMAVIRVKMMASASRQT